jgi:hypothetical protein
VASAGTDASHHERLTEMSRLISIGLVGHAVMHVGAVSCGLLFASGEPWLVTGAGLDARLVDSSAILLTSGVVAGFVGAALAEAGVLVPRSWRAPLIVVASTASAVMLAALFSPPVLPGLVIDALLLWSVLGRSLRQAGPARRDRGADRWMNGRLA